MASLSSEKQSRGNPAMSYQEVLNYWFEELSPQKWWVKDAAVDREIASRFATCHVQASRCELFSWRSCAQGRLAEIIVLDQFSRNLMRDSSGAFAADPLALCLAQHAVSLGVAAELPERERHFLYMPYMHSESLAIHQVARPVFDALGEGVRQAADSHRVIIERFGRYPHRNGVLGRHSTAEEIEFLKQPGSSF